MVNKYGYVRVGAIVPEMRVADTTFNTNEIIKLIKESDKLKIQIVVFPELSITGYTCADLFHQHVLLEDAMKGLRRVINETSKTDIISIIGMPLTLDNQLYNVAVVINKGKILGIVPKTFIPNDGEFYEKRWFTSSLSLISNEIKLFDEVVPIGTDILFRSINNKDICFGIEICADMWSIASPSTNYALNGATLLFNLSASNELIGKYDYRKSLVTMQSAKSLSAYIYTSCGISESSTDLVFSGHAMISENGSILEESERFIFDSQIIFNDIDVEKLVMLRYKDNNYMNSVLKKEYRYIPFILRDVDTDLKRTYGRNPFVPSNELVRDERCNEIFNIQASALAKRLKHTGVKKCIIGISGGLDSTLAFLVTIKAFDKLGIDRKGIIGITMPGFGTTSKTYNNSLYLVESFKATLREINIKDACLQHFKDINHDANTHDITYENTQARERTQILMDIANKENGLVIGTCDLSELALGWCTYNGDHMSMYAVNVSIPKTLVKYLVKWVADNQSISKNKEVLYDILNTTISPELLPPNELGEIKQVTEDKIGPYELHDFFLYHFMRFGVKPSKILYIAKKTFKDVYTDEEIKKWLIVFIKRFFTQQFKRSCIPDGPKVGTVSLSPRGDLRMPSDAVYNTWLNDLEDGEAK
jgi:NAD+ synthase (glutamine-hydrolysing)